MSQGDRRTALRDSSGAATRRWSGRHEHLDPVSSDNAREFLSHAERLVYLFPEGFSPDRLVADQTEGDGRPVFDFEDLIMPDYPPEERPAAPVATPGCTFVGHLETQLFAVEIRARSATIVADQFSVRRDLLLVLKEYVERRRGK